jgi:hypothetical protein
MAIYEILIGQQFGRLTVLNQEAPGKHGHRMFKCICICGNEITTAATHLVHGNTKSCGCLLFDWLRENKIIHGQRQNPVYHVWHCMKMRCSNPKNKAYKFYGARGITYDPTWETFKNFYDDIGFLYQPGLQLDRIDNNGNYTKDNVRWATRKQNTRNTRANRYITIEGETKLLCEWAEEYGITDKILHQRYNRDGHRSKEKLLAKMKTR